MYLPQRKMNIIVNRLRPETLNFLYSNNIVISIYVAAKNLCKRYQGIRSNVLYNLIFGKDQIVCILVR